MSRSSPSAPMYLFTAIDAVEGLLAEVYPAPLTAREIADALRDRGFRWPLRPTLRDGYRGSDGEPTQARVRRVCELKRNRTRISHAGEDENRRALYSIYDWAIDSVRERA